MASLWPTNIILGNPSDPATNMVPTETLYRSPKRKRDAIERLKDSDRPISPTSTPMASSQSELKLLEAEETGRCSPRAAVAGRFKNLAIHECVSHPTPIAQWRRNSPQLSSHESEALGEVRDGPLLSEESVIETEPPQQHAERNKSKAGQIFNDRSSNGVARSKVKAISPSKARRKKSPPPNESITLDSLTWSDSEITGHNPTDPNDDGYGINGIGFKPTAEIAWARSQHRLKQLAEWKNREANEARENRRARREGVAQVKLKSGPSSTAQKKVKFDLG